MKIYRPIFPELKRSDAGCYWASDLKGVKAFLKYKKASGAIIITAEINKEDIDEESCKSKQYGSKQIELFKLNRKTRIEVTGMQASPQS